MIFFQKNKLPFWQLGILFCLIFIPLYGASPDIWEDTGAYLYFDAVRPPIYPLFLWLFHRFGQHQLLVAMWVQSLINFLALVYAAYWLHTRLELPKFLIFILLAFSVVLLQHFSVYRSILTEALSFPLFIVAVMFFVDSFKDFNIKKVILLSLTVNVLVLTRGQFYYFYILFFMLIAWHIWKRSPLRKLLVGSLTIIFFITVAMLGNRAYHYVLHKHFSVSSASGAVFIQQAMYLSNLGDAAYFRNPDERLFFEKTMKTLEDKHLTRDNPPLILRPPIGLGVASEYYERAYFPIMCTVRSNLPSRNLYSYDSSAFLVKISKTLYVHNLKKAGIFYVWRVASFVGGPMFFLGFLIVLISICFRALTDRSWNPTIKQIFVSVSFFIILANAAVIGCCAGTDLRYFYYAYFLYLCLWGLLAKEFIQK